jgi:hypothetical protein
VADELEVQGPAHPVGNDALAEQEPLPPRVWPRMPATTIAGAIPNLRRPFTPEAVKFKVQTVFKGATGCIIVAYIDARLASERLNHVCPDLWYATYEEIPGTDLMWCHLTLSAVGQSITRSDVGESPKGLSKDLVSDALKRAAVHFGVGVSIYALPQIKLDMADGEKRLRRRTIGDGKTTLVLTEYGHQKLREGYASWLDAHGVELFGEPLDHGDVEGALFDEDEDQTQGVTEGTGDGTEPDWQGLTEKQISRAEGLIGYAEELGHGGYDRALVKMRLNGQSPPYVDRWLEQHMAALNEYGEAREPEAAEQLKAQRA